MTIAELIEELEKMPQDAEVYVRNGWKDFVTVESVVFIDQCKTPWVAIDSE
jgi:hypothetical protein